MTIGDCGGKFVMLLFFAVTNLLLLFGEMFVLSFSRFFESNDLILDMLLLFLGIILVTMAISF